MAEPKVVFAISINERERASSASSITKRKIVANDGGYQFSNQEVQAGRLANSRPAPVFSEYHSGPTSQQRPSSPQHHNSSSSPSSSPSNKNGPPSPSYMDAVMIRSNSFPSSDSQAQPQPSSSSFASYTVDEAQEIRSHIAAIVSSNPLQASAAPPPLPIAVSSRPSSSSASHRHKQASLIQHPTVMAVAAAANSLPENSPYRDTVGSAVVDFVTGANVAIRRPWTPGTGIQYGAVKRPPSSSYVTSHYTKEELDIVGGRYNSPYVLDRRIDPHDPQSIATSGAREIYINVPPDDPASLPQEESQPHFASPLRRRGSPPRPRRSGRSSLNNSRPNSSPARHRHSGSLSLNLSPLQEQNQQSSLFEGEFLPEQLADGQQQQQQAEDSGVEQLQQQVDGITLVESDQWPIDPSQQQQEQYYDDAGDAYYDDEQNGEYFDPDVMMDMEKRIVETMRQSTAPLTSNYRKVARSAPSSYWSSSSNPDVSFVRTTPSPALYVGSSSTIPSNPTPAQQRPKTGQVRRLDVSAPLQRASSAAAIRSTPVRRSSSPTPVDVAAAMSAPGSPNALFIGHPTSPSSAKSAGSGSTVTARASGFSSSYSSRMSNRASASSNSMPSPNSSIEFFKANVEEALKYDAAKVNRNRNVFHPSKLSIKTFLASK